MPRELTPYRSRLVEQNLQRIIGEMAGHRPSSAFLAGAPIWLLHGKTFRDTDKAYKTSLGYEFRPDQVIEFEGQDQGKVLRVLELKLAAKAEPLALAEALHHAYAIGTPGFLAGANGEVAETRAVLMTQFNTWLRASLGKLMAIVGEPASHKIRDAIMLLEHTWYEHEGRPLVWFEAPFAQHTPCAEAPTECAGAWSTAADLHHDEFDTWWRVEETQSWMVTKANFPLLDPFHTAEYAIVSRITDAREATNQWAIWKGSVRGGKAVVSPGP